MDLPHLSVRLSAVAAFVLYVAALGLPLKFYGAKRWIWTLAFLCIVVHVVLAFHVVHHWSQDAAHQATARQTADVFKINWGGGAFVNYALLLIWAVQVIRWWRGGLSISSQLFLAFIWFNGVIVFAHDRFAGSG